MKPSDIWLFTEIKVRVPWKINDILIPAPTKEFWKAEAPVSDLQLKAQDTKSRQAEASSAEKQREANNG